MRAALFRLTQSIPFLLGGFLPALLGLRAGEVTWTLLVSAALAGFVALLTLSVVTRSRPRVRHRAFWSWTSLALVVATAAAAANFSVQLERLTFIYEPEGRSARFLRGTEYTPLGERARQSEANVDDATLIAKAGGVGKRSRIWTEASIERARIWLGLSNAFLIVCVGGALFAALELSGMEERHAPFPQTAPKQVAARRQARRFDIFLCHNSRDKAAVKEVAAHLVRRGMVPWLDEWELRPGTAWVPAIESELRTVRSAAVFIGPSGAGPWQQMEANALLNQFVQRGAPVIPVLLPGVEDPLPELPVFLEGMTWVDMRRRDPDPIEQLLFGITGTNATGEQRA